GRFFSTETNVVPVIDATATNLDRVALHPNLVSAGAGDAKAAPTETAGVREDAGDAAHCLTFSCLRTRYGTAARAHIRLRMRIENRKIETIAPCVAFARTEVAKRGFIASIDARDASCRLNQFGGQGRTQSVVGSRHVAGQLYMRDVQSRPNLVEAIRLAIPWEFALHLNPRQVEKIADGVFVLIGVQAAKTSTSAFGCNLLLPGRECRFQTVHELRAGRGGWPGHSRRWHFAGRDTVIHLDPNGKVVRIGRFEAQVLKIESPRTFRRAMANRAVLIDKNIGADEGRSGITGKRRPDPCQHDRCRPGEPSFTQYASSFTFRHEISICVQPQREQESGFEQFDGICFGTR